MNFIQESKADVTPFLSPKFIGITLGWAAGRSYSADRLYPGGWKFWCLGLYSAKMQRYSLFPA